MVLQYLRTQATETRCEQPRNATKAGALRAAQLDRVGDLAAQGAPSADIVKATLVEHFADKFVFAIPSKVIPAAMATGVR